MKNTLIKETSFEKKEFLLIVFALVTLFLLNAYMNSWVNLSTLSLDDLTEWTAYRNSTTTQFIFNTEANKLRVVFNIFIYLCYKFFGTNIYLFEYVNLLVSFLIACILFFIARKVSKNLIVGFCVAIGFILSRFAYYQISQVFGIMEAMALLFAVGILYCLYEFINGAMKSNRYYFVGCGLYLLVCFTHERYLVLFPLFLIAYFCREQLQKINIRRILLLLAPTLVFLFTMVIRKLLLGDRTFDGTGGTSIADSLNLLQGLKFALSQVAFILGINAGPNYLTGIGPKDVPAYIYAINGIAILCITVTTVLFLISLIRNKETRNQKLKNVLLFVSFIGACIISSSVTIRVEMRWIYVSYSAFLLLFAYMIGILLNEKDNKIVKHSVLALILIYIIALVPMESYFRANWKNLYYWGTQAEYNSLYEETVQNYTKAVWGKKFVLVDKDYTEVKNKEFIEKYEGFFRQFKDNDQQANPILTIVKNSDDIPAKSIRDRDTILWVDHDNYRYVNVSTIMQPTLEEKMIGKSLRETKPVNDEDGWYGWEGNNTYRWTKQNFKVELISGDSGLLHLYGITQEYNLPNLLIIHANGNKIAEKELIQSRIDLTIEVPKNEVLKLEFQLQNVKSQLEAGVGGDVRSLGVCVADIICE